MKAPCRKNTNSPNRIKTPHIDGDYIYSSELCKELDENTVLQTCQLRPLPAAAPLDKCLACFHDGHELATLLRNGKYGTP